MFANTNIQVGVSQRVVATLVACAMVLFSVGAYNIAQAASYTQVSDTLSDSEPSATSAHFISFTVPTGSSIGTGDTISLTFPTDTNEFTNVSAVVTTDLVVQVNGATSTHLSFANTASAPDRVISFNNIAAAAGQVVTVAIAGGIITNPDTLGSYRIDISNGTDSASTMIAIVDTVTVSASVDTLFTFTVSGTATSTVVNGDTTDYATGTTTIDFGEINADTQYTLAQRLTVTTNAINGYAVTVETDGNLRSVNGADIDTFTNGTDVTTATAWTGPTPSVGNEDTYGHWGMTYNDTTLNGGVVLAAGQYIAASTTPRQVFYHDDVSDGTTEGEGTALVGYAVQISGLQEAADDYTAVLTYIATPSF